MQKTLLYLSIITIIVSSITLFLSKYFFIFDLFSHFQLQYLIGLLLFSFGLSLYKNIKFLLINIIYILFLFITFIQPVSFAQESINKTDIFFMNTKFKNTNNAPIINEIKKQNPQIIALVEPNKALIDEITDFFGSPIIEINKKTNSYAIFSKKQPISQQVINTESLSLCYVEFDDFILLTIHTLDPLTPAKRNINLNFFEEIDQIITKLDSENKKFILTGDFNNTYYSATFRKHFKKYFQKNLYSWSLFMPWTIPIDHALSNMPISTSRTPILSSDHVGLLIDIL